MLQFIRNIWFAFLALPIWLIIYNTFQQTCVLIWLFIGNLNIVFQNLSVIAFKIFIFLIIYLFILFIIFIMVGLFFFLLLAIFTPLTICIFLFGMLML